MKLIFIDFLKSIYGGKLLTGYFGVFWFITCLFFTQIFYAFIHEKIHSKQVARFFITTMGLATSIVVIIFPWLHLPWALSVVPLAMLIYGFGHYLRESNTPHNILTFLALIVILVCLCCSYLGLTFQLDMKALKFGPFILGLLLAFALSWLVIIFCQFISKLKLADNILGNIGKASLVIMFLHQLIHLSLRSWQIKNDILIFILSIIIPFFIYLLATQSRLTSTLLLGQR